MCLQILSTTNWNFCLFLLLTYFSLLKLSLISTKLLCGPFSHTTFPGSSSLYMVNMSDVKGIVHRWLQGLNEAVVNADIEAFAELFLPDGWLRDNLIFTWNHRSLDGRDAIKAFLSHVDEQSCPNETRLSKAKISNIQLKPLYNIVPQVTPHQLIEGTFTFETPIFFGKGYVLLKAEFDEEKIWKAFSLYVAATDLKGHEEDGTPIGYYDNHAKTWQQTLEEERRKVEEDPHVIVCR